MLCIRAGGSLLAPHARDELNLALKILEDSSSESPFAAELAPRLRSLQEQAILAVVSAQPPLIRPKISAQILAKLSSHGCTVPAPNTPSSSTTTHQLQQQQMAPPYEPYIPVNTPAPTNVLDMPRQDPSLGSVVAPEPFYTMMQQPRWAPGTLPMEGYPRYFAHEVQSQSHSPVVTPNGYQTFQPLQDYFSHLLPPQQDHRMAMDTVSNFGGTAVYDQLISGKFRAIFCLRHPNVPGWQILSAR
jgi:hypothetical protein